MDDNNLKKKVVLSGVVVFAVLIAILSYYYFSQRADALKKYQITKQEASYLHHRAEFDQSIEKYREAMTIVPDKDKIERSRLISKIGFDLFSRNAEGDRSEAIRLFKELVADAQLPNQRRATAMNQLAFNLYKIGANERENLAPLVFGEEPYRAYLAEAGGDASRAVRRLFEEADKLYPNAESKSMIALMYGDRIREQPEPGLTRDEIAEIMQRYANDALPLFNDPDYRDVYSNARLALLYSAAARALDWSNQFLHNTSPSAIETVYAQAVQIADREPLDLHSQASGILARYHYAIFLANHYGSLRKDDIANFLDAVAELAAEEPYHSSFRRYIALVASRPETNYTKSHVLMVSKMSDRFRVFLLDNGWEI